jgi:hypothetical protein
MNADPKAYGDWQLEASSLRQLAASEYMEKVQQQVDGLTLAFCEIAIHAWRANRRMRDRHSGEVKEEHKATFRSVEGIMKTLESVGFTLRDREGEAYDFGLPEKVIASEKRPGIIREVVAETIRPSVFFNDHLIRPGEIIIAGPEDPANPSDPESSPRDNIETANT